eukprot:CAMPEP_0201901176 /NCGR_PEP_ID=MMETSP0902-20130614/53796_1 /ASSEMBLY_ACC=CAM_ASM_000551 /TAXON_ID=420261 /ORGANISM="Thalassiosira antarctica, Strain CCMP982" /LENGTH=560 /DNA_ID=CAMNT_0048435051 /DNA_START=652 /DNA_END=2334 /DNA_ORIENTATION=+
MESSRQISAMPMMTATSSSLTSSSNNDNLPSSNHLSSSSCTFYSTTTSNNATANEKKNDNGNNASLLPHSSPTQPAATATITRSKSTEKKAAMDDEYGTMNSAGKTYTYPSPYHLESFGTFGHTGNAATTQLPRGVLHPAYVNYNTYGTLNEARDNVLVICHALTGNASLDAWWGELLGPGMAFDTDRYFIVCCNILGSCYGSVGPSSIRPGYDEDTKPEDIPEGVPRNKSNQAIYGMDYPDVSVRDTVRLQLLLLKHELKINSIKCVIGGSFGGMQAMEYCVMAGSARPVGGNGTVGGNGGNGNVNGMGTNNNSNSNNGTIVPGTTTRPLFVGDKNGGSAPYSIGEFVTKRNGRIEPFVRSAIPIACGAAHTAWQIGISETQRQAIYADPKWNKNGRYDPHDPPSGGLSVARQVAMVSYRTPLGYHRKFGRALTDESGPSYGSRAPWQVKSYLEYQGKKFLDRFDPVTYVKLTEQMDSHDIGRGRGGSIEQVLGHVEIPVCVLGIDSDVLYPLREQEELVRGMPHAELKIIHSDAGHDGFLLEQDQVAAHIKSFLYSYD